MKVLTSKMVNGKKMFLIDDNNPQGKVFAQDGKPIKKENISYYNPYYVDIKGLNASESTKTNLTPATKITPQEIKKIKESPTNVGNIKIKEAQEKAQRLKEAEEAYKKRKAGAPITPELLAQETQAIGDKISLQNIPGVGQYIPDMLDVTGGIGSMASNLGALPLNLNRGNYGQAALSVVMPLGVGALAGIGNPNTGQFANNLINPFAGTGQIINKLGNKYLPNAPKFNTYYHNSNNLNLSLEDIDLFRTGKSQMKKRYRLLDESEHPSGFYTTNNKDAVFMGGDNTYSFEMPKNSKIKDLSLKGRTTDRIPKKELKQLKEEGYDVIKGKNMLGLDEYIPINKEKMTNWKNLGKRNEAKSNFESEINWGQWNKEIPDNPQLIKEYNTIEQSSKANGSWMKNPDGSKFQGTPEQFVQQNSSNFKKAFPKGFNTTYRGTMSHFVENFNPNRSMATFTGSKDLASSYSGKGWSTDVNYLTSDSPEFSGGMYELAHPKSTNSLTFDGMNDDWTSISLLPPEVKKKTILDNISRISSSIEKQKSFLNSGIQDPVNKSWKFPGNDVTYSDELYKQGTTHMENILKGYKESLKYADQPLDNPTLLENMRKKLGDRTITDNIAKYIKDNNVDYVKIININDGGFGDVSMVNHKEGNFLKSLRGNNGMFDMKNPDIYKTLIPGAMTLGALNQTNEKQFGGTIKVLDTKIEKNKKYYLINE